MVEGGEEKDGGRIDRKERLTSYHEDDLFYCIEKRGGDSIKKRKRQQLMSEAAKRTRKI